MFAIVKTINLPMSNHLMKECNLASTKTLYFCAHDLLGTKVGRSPIFLWRYAL